MKPKVAIVADNMVTLGGGERVVEVLAKAFPDAPIFTPIFSPDCVDPSIRDRVKTSWLQNMPFSQRYAKAFVPFYVNAIESFDLSGYDIIISSHYALIKGVLKTAEQTHVCYCHTPMRALWERTHAEINGMPGFMAGSIRRFFTELRLWDYIAAARVDQFIANSTITRRRIAAFYRRDSVVITPPIETERFTVGNVPAGDYYLVASRNVPYKKIDLAIAAAEQLGRRLIVMGEGTDKLTSSSPLIEFRGKVSGDEFLNLMRGAKALLAPQIEDFGMSILEANACGRPVIALARGGALETLIDGHTGVLFEEQTVESLTDAIIRFERTAFDTAAIRRNAERFSQERFIANVRELVLRVHDERLQQEPRAFDLPTQLVSASG